MGITPRRAFIKKGAVLFASLAAVLGAAREGFGATEVAEAATSVPNKGKAASPLTNFFGRNWHLVSETRGLGELPSPGMRGAVYGELFDSPEGAKVGEFYAATFWVGSPFGESAMSAQALEMHTFRFPDGTVLGMGSQSGAESVYAIVGGTGRYHGATGSYVASQRTSGAGGDGSADFTFMLQV